jgi:hypothetical protein
MNHHAHLGNTVFGNWRWYTGQEDDSPQAAAQLLPLVYDELRRLAAGYVANESDVPRGMKPSRKFVP